MLYVNQKLLKEIPEPLKDVMGYYPDVLLFEFNQTQYTYFWQRVTSAKYLYTNGYEIRPTNWFMYVFQTFKGWCGLRNHCHQGKITYTLNKLAYYGYTKQFKQPDYSSVLYSLSPEVCHFSSQNRDDKITERLQKKLITDFFKLEFTLNINYPDQCIYGYHRFGDSWKNIDKMELIPALDPQDDSLIAELVSEFDKRGYSPTQLNFIPKSKYARAAAVYHSEKFKREYESSKSQYWIQRWFEEQLLGHQVRIADHLAKALIYNPEIIYHDPQTLISYYIDKKEYAKAFDSLDLLNDPNLAMEFFKKIPEGELPPLTGKIEPNTKMAAIIANVYIEKKDYEAAKKFFTNIEQLNPIAGIYLEIQKNNYSRAYAIFEQYQEAINLFPCSERTRLAKIFSEGGEIAYNTGKTLREAKRWGEAEQNYLLSLNQKKAAYRLNASQKYLNEIHAHRRLYALLLIDADIDLHNPEASEVQNIQKGIMFLKECQSSEASEQVLKDYALARGLMRQIDTLREKISLDGLPGDSDFLTKHKTQHQQDINRLIKTLEELIVLLKGTTDQEQRIMLGKAHYLLADVQLYFEINAPNINDNYKMAKEANPNNPFYLLRYSEIFEQEQEQNREMAVIKLKNIGFTVFDYYHWSEERWCKRDAIIYNIKDIHQNSDGSNISEQKGNLLSYLI